MDDPPPTTTTTTKTADGLPLCANLLTQTIVLSNFVRLIGDRFNLSNHPARRKETLGLERAPLQMPVNFIPSHNGPPLVKESACPPVDNAVVAVEMMA